MLSRAGVEVKQELEEMNKQLSEPQEAAGNDQSVL